MMHFSPEETSHQDRIFKYSEFSKIHPKIEDRDFIPCTLVKIVFLFGLEGNSLKNQEKMWRKWNPYIRLMEVKISTTILENRMEIPPNLKVLLSYDSAIPLLGMFLEETKSVH